MDIKSYIDDNVIFIVHDNYKTTLLKIINESPLLNIKIITINELKKKLIFEYNEKTIYYVMKEENLSYNNAIEYIESLYYLTDELKNSKLIRLNNLKNKLEENNLLIHDKYFSSLLTNKKVYVLGFDHLLKLDFYLIDQLKKVTTVNIIEEKPRSFEHIVLQFKNINDEIEYVANEIIKKINFGINLNDIYIANFNTEYDSTIKRVFDFYNIPINFQNNSSLYDTSTGLKVLNNLDNYESVLKEIKDSDLYNNILDIFNKYYWIDNYFEIKDLLTEEFKKKKITTAKYQKAINLIDLKNHPIKDQEHIFLIGFTEEFIPTIYKDDDLISDLEKNELLEPTEELNRIERETWLKIIKRIRNLTITYSNQGLKGILHPSPLIAEMKVEKQEYQASNYSNISNQFNLIMLLDEKNKYGINHPEINRLSGTYPNLEIYSYQNSYKKINPKLIKKFYQNGLYLSYSKINTYFECAFKYYLDNVLKLNEYSETFDTYLGSLTHYILSKIYEPDFNLNTTKEEFLSTHPFELTKENIIFINKMVDELKFIIQVLKEHYDLTTFKEIECERKLQMEKYDGIKIIFTGIIDKIMKYENNIAIIDYKTYNPKIDLSLVNYGLKMQLPFYIYLIKHFYPEAKITGIYLQPITRDIIKYDPNKSVKEQKISNMKLVGYTIDDEKLVSLFDPTYEKSQFIYGMSTTSNGFKHTTKILSDRNFNLLADIADMQIDAAVKNILDANFEINPKIENKNNLSCENCKYKAICFVKHDNYVYINADKDLTFFKEGLE